MAKLGGAKPGGKAKASSSSASSSVGGGGGVPPLWIFHNLAPLGSVSGQLLLPVRVVASVVVVAGAGLLLRLPERVFFVSRSRVPVP